MHRVEVALSALTSEYWIHVIQARRDQTNHGAAKRHPSSQTVVLTCPPYPAPVSWTKSRPCAIGLFVMPKRRFRYLERDALRCDCLKIYLVRRLSATEDLRSLVLVTMGIPFRGLDCQVSCWTYNYFMCFHNLFIDVKRNRNMHPTQGAVTISQCSCLASYRHVLYPGASGDLVFKKLRLRPHCILQRLEEMSPN